MDAKEALFFKFQSDSINTFTSAANVAAFFSLNSNLILLILSICLDTGKGDKPLNSNLILLIRL